MYCNGVEPQINYANSAHPIYTGIYRDISGFRLCRGTDQILVLCTYIFH